MHGKIPREKERKTKRDTYQAPEEISNFRLSLALYAPLMTWLHMADYIASQIYSVLSGLLQRGRILYLAGQQKPPEQIEQKQRSQLAILIYYTKVCPQSPDNGSTTGEQRRILAKQPEPSQRVPSQGRERRSKPDPLNGSIKEKQTTIANPKRRTPTSWQAKPNNTMKKMTTRNPHGKNIKTRPFKLQYTHPTKPHKSEDSKKKNINS